VAGRRNSGAVCLAQLKRNGIAAGGTGIDIGAMNGSTEEYLRPSFKTGENGAANGAERGEPRERQENGGKARPNFAEYIPTSYNITARRVVYVLIVKR